jgi:hypothetical protein
VKQSKNQENVSQGQVKNRDKTWKSKAITRGEENRRLKKRIKELEKSRDLWRRKFQLLCLKLGKSMIGAEKARGHQYSLGLVLLVIELQKYGTMSLRSCRHCVATMLLAMNLRGRVPSHNTIRNWACKSGYYRVKTSGEGSGQHILYVDESIVFGAEKILLILGIATQNVPKDRSVNHSDIEVLYVGVSKEWKSESIWTQIDQIGQAKKISYIVSDEGINLRKAYKMGNYVHIEDCTHVLANHLKHIYQKDRRFEGFRKLIGQLRITLYLSKEKSPFMPPSMRGKLRFANMFPCIDWAKNCLDKWTTLSLSIQTSLSFLKDNQDFIEELVTIEKAFKLVCATLKNKGFGQSQKAEILKELSVLYALNNRDNVLIFIKNIEEYLENLTLKSQHLGEEHLLCCSDIIESFFGKFKQKINPNSKSGLSEFIFTIANFTKSYTEEEVKLALENVQIADLKKYRNRARSS